MDAELPPRFFSVLEPEGISAEVLRTAGESFIEAMPAQETEPRFVTARVITLLDLSEPALYAFQMEHPDASVWVVGGPAADVATVPILDDPVEALENWLVTFTPNGLVGLIGVANGTFSEDLDGEDLEDVYVASLPLAGIGLEVPAGHSEMGGWEDQVSDALMAFDDGEGEAIADATVVLTPDPAADPSGVGPESVLLAYIIVEDDLDDPEQSIRDAFAAVLAGDVDAEVLAEALRVIPATEVDEDSPEGQLVSLLGSLGGDWDPEEDFDDLDDLDLEDLEDLNLNGADSSILEAFGIDLEEFGRGGSLQE